MRQMTQGEHVHTCWKSRWLRRETYREKGWENKKWKQGRKQEHRTEGVDRHLASRLCYITEPGISSQPICHLLPALGDATIGQYQQQQKNRKKTNWREDEYELVQPKNDVWYHASIYSDVYSFDRHSLNHLEMLLWLPNFAAAAAAVLLSLKRICRRHSSWKMSWFSSRRPVQSTSRLIRSTFRCLSLYDATVRNICAVNNADARCARSSRHMAKRSVSSPPSPNSLPMKRYGVHIYDPQRKNKVKIVRGRTQNPDFPAQFIVFLSEFFSLDLHRRSRLRYLPDWCICSSRPFFRQFLAKSRQGFPWSGHKSPAP